MSANGSVTRWIDRVRAGEPDAARQLWHRYFDRLVRLARGRLREKARRSADEEDVALDAFDSFCRAAEAGRFPKLDDRNDIWQVLTVITARKAADLVQHQNRQKRGGGAVQGESALMRWTDGIPDGPGLDGLDGAEPSPDEAAVFADECRRLLGKLTDPTLKTVVLLRMEGYSAREISGRMGCAVRTVERKLRRVQLLWRDELPPGNSPDPE
jgi:DNA-directed RNA polymerase specialized sigma24 family protein